MEQRVRFTERETADLYRFPLTRTLLSATTEGTAETIGTVRAQSIGQVGRLAVGNQTGSAVDLTVYFIPDGGTIGASNREITALSIPANSNVDMTDFIGGLYAPGTVIKAFASTTNALILMGYVEGRL